MQSQGKSMGTGLLRSAIGFDKTLLVCKKHIQWTVLMALSWLHEKKKALLPCCPKLGRDGGNKSHYLCSILTCLLYFHFVPCIFY